MDVRERLIQLLSGEFTDFCELSVIAGTCKIRAITFNADDFADFLIRNGVTITPAVPGPVVGHDITELCFRNGKEEGRKELKAEVMSHLLDQKTKVNGLCHAHVVELMKFVEGLYLSCNLRGVGYGNQTYHI